MKINKQARREARQLFKSCLENGLLNETKARQAVAGLVQTKPRNYVGILSHFQRLVKLDTDRRTARVVSASPLSPELQGNVKEALARSYGPGLNISFGQDPSLLGGLRVQVGSDVYDGSVKARLASLEASF